MTDNSDCPKCKSKKVLRIVYGLIRKPLGEGRVAGGCMVSGDSPMYRCGSCGYEWGKSIKRTKKPFLCKIGIHKWDRTVVTSHGFSSNALDCKKMCLRCGETKRWVRIK